MPVAHSPHVLDVALPEGSDVNVILDAAVASWGAIALHHDRAYVGTPLVLPPDGREASEEAVDRLSAEVNPNRSIIAPIIGGGYLVALDVVAG